MPVYVTLFAVSPKTASLDVVKVRSVVQTFGVKLLRILTVYFENGSNFATIPVLFVLIVHNGFRFGVFVNSTSTKSLLDRVTGFHFTVATMPGTDT